MILLGIDVQRLFLQHLWAGDWQSLYGGGRPCVGGGGGGAVGGTGSARHHHDDVAVVGGSALYLHHALPRPPQLLQLDLLVLTLHLHRLVDQRLPVRGLEDLLSVLYLNDLLLSAGSREDLYLLGLDVCPRPLYLDLLAPRRRHVLHDDLLPRRGLDDLLALAGRNHPANKHLVS